MVTNRFFTHYEESSEQNLYEDLYAESIQIHGMDVYYIPRKRIEEDSTFREYTVTHYEEALKTDAYLKNVDAFEGEGDFLSKFGLEIRDQITMSFSKKTFREEVARYLRTERPLEGDLIWFPLGKKLFTIKNTNTKRIFFQLGTLFEFEVVAELFEYSNETFNTGIPEIDNTYNAFSTKEDLSDPVEDISDSDIDIIDLASQNKFFQSEGDKIIDEFSTDNPFGDV